MVSVQAKNVKGVVRCGEETLAGVIVTDGTHFTTTAADGSYKLKLGKEAAFVYVVSPSGYTVDFSTGTPVFYQSVSKSRKYDFELTRTTDSTDFTLLAISDPQMKTKKHYEKFCGKPLDDLKAMAAQASAEGLAVGVCLGDLGWDSVDLMNPLYKQALSGICIPMYPVIGNHDFNRAKKGRDSRRDYEASFGPVNYAFYLGQDLVIVLKDIIYDTDKKYKEGYTDEELDFVRNLLAFVPEDRHIFIAQHSPLYRWFNGKDIVAGDDMLAILQGRKVDFICGHTHISNHLVYSKDIVEHNPASICGSWWDTVWCNDGTPRGYSVFSRKGGELSWHYHMLDFDDDFQVNIIKPGQSRMHPNSVVANIWDYDDAWSVKWYQDGALMGDMVQVADTDPEYIREINKVFEGKDIPKFKRPRLNVHYFAATPSPYASFVTVEVTSRFGKSWKYDVDLKTCLDVQAHRGGAGLMPEDTEPAMKNAIDLGCNTLELDLQLSSDGQVVVSHDAYFHHRCSTRPDGSEVQKDDPKEYLYNMPYETIARYDVGMKANEIWPDKALVPAVKPLAGDLIDFCESYAIESHKDLPRYNIEIKSSARKGEGADWPEYKEFVDACVPLLESKHLGDRLVVQSFDVRALEYMHEKYPELILSYLTTKKQADFDEFMSLLTFTPDVLSPEYSVVTEEMVRKCHEKGMKIVPWTCDDEQVMKEMIALGCDAVITNYPDRLLKITRGY